MRATPSTVAEVRDQLREEPQVHAYTLGISPVAPKSRGSIRLKSSSAVAPPAIDYGLLTDPAGDDARVLVAGARLAREHHRVGGKARNRIGVDGVGEAGGDGRVAGQPRRQAVAGHASYIEVRLTPESLVSSCFQPR